MAAQANPGEAPPTGFQFTPRGPFQVRNYDDEPLSALEPVYEHVDALIEKHKVFIPGSMVRLMRQWRDDLWRAIESHDKEAETEEAQSEEDDWQGKKVLSHDDYHH
jgi:hypothetical protein